MLVFSARAGAIATRIGPRIPLTVGPFLVAAGLLLLTAVQPGDDYVTDVLPGVVLFSVGLVVLVAPVTATVLAAAGDAHVGTASGVNNAVARLGSLLAIATVPELVGLGGDDFYSPASMTTGFHTAMIICAALCVAGGAIAALFVSDELRSRPDLTVYEPQRSSDLGCPPARAAMTGAVSGPRE